MKAFVITAIAGTAVGTMIMHLLMIPGTVAVLENTDSPPKQVFWTLFCLMVLEFFLLSGPKMVHHFWRVMKQVNEPIYEQEKNGDIIQNAASWFLRIFIINHLLIIFYQVEIATQTQVLLFFGATGNQGLSVIRAYLIGKFVQRKENKNTNLRGKPPAGGDK